jgi:hypothetical protein
MKALLTLFLRLFKGIPTLRCRTTSSFEALLRLYEGPIKALLRAEAL